MDGLMSLGEQVGTMGIEDKAEIQISLTADSCLNFTISFVLIFCTVFFTMFMSYLCIFYTL